MKVLCPRCGASVEAHEATATCAACGATFPAGEAKTSVEGPPPPDPLLGTVVGGCKLLERIGAGGMGVVYKAEQLSLGRTVAVKLLPEPLRRDSQIEDRFRREIAILARLSHPNIVGILDGGVSEHGAYFVMEHVEGVSLRRVLAQGGVSPQEALRIIPQVCDALEYAHERGVVHRDIKPENILLDSKGRVRLLDFGLSRITGEDGPGLLTRATQVLGTFEYMAPEQREASRGVDHRADLYSLGVVIYEMLTGELPIGRFDPPSKRNVQVDVRLDEVVLRVLEKAPERRYQSASAIRSEVTKISTTPPVETPAATAAPSGAAPPPPPGGAPPHAESAPPTPPPAPAPAAESAHPPRPVATPWIWGAIAIVAIVGISSGFWFAVLPIVALMAILASMLGHAGTPRAAHALWIGVSAMGIVGLEINWVGTLSLMGLAIGGLLASRALRYPASSFWTAVGFSAVGVLGVACGPPFWVGALVVAALLLFVLPEMIHPEIRNQPTAKEGVIVGVSYSRRHRDREGSRHSQPPPKESPPPPGAATAPAFAAVAAPAARISGFATASLVFGVLALVLGVLAGAAALFVAAR